MAIQFDDSLAIGEAQCSMSAPRRCPIEDQRLDSGICNSFQSTDSIRSQHFPALKSTQLDSSNQTSLLEETRQTSVDSGLGSLEGNTAPSLHHQLENLNIHESLPEESIRSTTIPVPAPRRILTVEALSRRTREQKLRDLETYDFNSSEEPIKSKKKHPESSVCESLRCSSLTEEEERPQHFQQDADGDTFLHLMIVHEQAAHSEQVIAGCPSWSLLNIQNDHGQTPLHLAVLTGQAATARLLLVHGAAVDVRDRHGNTPLHLACRRGAMACVLALTRRVQHKEAARHDMACRYAVPFQRIPQPPELQNYDGHTCLQLAALGKHFEVMKQLVIECRGNINDADWKSGRTLLHRASEENDVSMAEFLLSHPRIDARARTYEGHTPLRLSIGRGHKDIVQLLMLAGAEDEDMSEGSLHGSSDEENMNTNDYDSDVDDGFDDMEYKGQSVFPR